jgi:hypothetical protein
MSAIVDFTHMSKRNSDFPRVSVHVANGAEFVALGLTEAELHQSTNVLYLHIHRESRKCYVGITVQEAAKRWFAGNAYKQNRRFGPAVTKHGWSAFDSYVLAFAEDREVLNAAEVAAIAAAGGHKSKYTYNLSPGGDMVAENDKPIVGVHLETGKLQNFKSGSDAARTLGIKNTDMPMAVARGERTSCDGWWFRFEDDVTAQPPVAWGESLRLNSVRDMQGKPVVAINLGTAEERTFPTTGAAAEALGIHQSQVSGIARGNDLSAKGWWFKFEGDTRPPPAIHGQKAGRLLRDKVVYAVNLKTGRRHQFRNCTVADSELGIYMGAAAAVALGARTSAAGWWFTYDPDGAAPTEYKGALVATARSKAVIATELATGQETTFSSAKEAAAALSMSRATISFNISGKLKSAKGYSFRFA